ncbi:MAG: hypothetical protein F4Y91_12390, partial [Gemmatimonadetes bacterium]|nr:hypothetical protein [Gemmatimonadota bacterium]
MSDNYHNLLKEAAQLYKKYEAGYPDPFNIFSVLRKEKDEVYLHSRFLYELLNYSKPGSQTRENLEDFLQHVGVEGFELWGAKVERERDYIDIRIINDTSRQAIMIENKIEASDRSEQLQKYYDTLEKNYSKIHPLYLTLYGRKPSPFSIGGLDPKKIITISYKCLIPWLERCRDREENKSSLRDAIAQYIQLVRKLTRTDARGKYMDALKKLCLENNNLVLVHDLNNVMLEAMREAIWNEIKAELRSEDPDFPDMEVNEYGLSYELNEVSQIEVGTCGNSKSKDGRIWFGVSCSEKDYKHKYDKIKKSLESFLGCGEPDTEEIYPWWRYADTGYVDTHLNLENPTREALEILSNEEQRKKIVRKVAQGLQELLEVIEDIAMVNAIEE